ncbi:MAG: WD40 repeat domain-containing protein, partial [Planctomycetota bacterium]
FAAEKDELMSGAEDGFVRKWRLADGACTWHNSQKDRAPVEAVAYSATGKTFAWSTGHMVHVNPDPARVTDGPKNVVHARGHVLHLVLSELEDVMAAVALDGAPPQWWAWGKTADPQFQGAIAIQNVPVGARCAVITWNRDGRPHGIFAHGLRRFTVHDTFDEVARVDTPGVVSALAVSMLLGHIACGDEQGTVGVYAMVEGQPPRRVLEADTKAPVRLVAISRDGDRVVSSSADGQVRLHEPGSGRTSVLVSSRDVKSVDALALSPDGALLAVASDRLISLWDVAAGRCLWSQR